MAFAGQRLALALMVAVVAQPESGLVPLFPLGASDRGSCETALSKAGQMSLRDFDETGRHILMEELKKSSNSDKKAALTGAFVMLNGMNEGIGIVIKSAEWRKHSDPRHWLIQHCTGSVALSAALGLDAPGVTGSSWLRLYATDGTPVHRNLDLHNHAVQPIITDVVTCGEDDANVMEGGRPTCELRPNYIIT